MPYFSLAYHYTSAKTLYRQRMGLLQSKRVNMQFMLEIEKRLRKHLKLLAGKIDAREKQPEQIADIFVYLATRLISSDKNQQRLAANLACDWLQDDSPVSFGARDALILFPIPEVYHVIRKMYCNVEKLRSVLLYILIQQGIYLPESLYRLAGSEPKDAEISAQLLHYAANNRHSDVNLFRPYYSPLVDGAPLHEQEHSLLVAAIWGGLIRGDVDARIALQLAVEKENDETQQLEYLRLAALSGQEKYFRVIQQLAEYAPEVGYHFLALHGSRHSVEQILTGLAHPRTSPYAEQAWWWVSGQTLARKARLSLVGQLSNHSPYDDEIGSVPDAALAEQWWAMQKSDSSYRWLHGKEYSHSRVLQLMKIYSGQASSDMMDLYALSAQSPVQISEYSWHFERLDKIELLAQTQTSATVERSSEMCRA